jgi:translation initiation factor 3 subunit G
MPAWGDDDDDVLQADEHFGPDANGIKTVKSYKFDSLERKKVVITKSKVTVIKTRTSKAAVERRATMHLHKFGHAQGLPPGIDDASTQVSYEDIDIEAPLALDEKKDDTPDVLKKMMEGSFQVSTKWRAGANGVEMPPGEGGGGGLAGLAAGDGAPTKYVPPSMRAGATEGGKGGYSDRDDSASLRVTNISQDTAEQDLRELFGNFGHVARVYLAKDRDTGRSRGFAFVSYHTRRDAQRAMENLHGYGYDHLILQVEWAKPSTREGEAPKEQFRSGYGKALAQDTKEKFATVGSTGQGTTGRQ